jgi:hypothetical protein
MKYFLASGRSFKQILNEYGLASFEYLLGLRKKSSNACPPVFIIGAPRSGSTLLVQAIVNSLDVAYMSNLHCLLYGAPVFPELIRKYSSRSPYSFESNHGATQGWGAPAECGQYWYRFFPRRPQYCGLNDVDQKRLLQLQNSVNTLLNVARRPFIFKNMHVALRLLPITKTFPNALFIIIRRNEVENGHSLLETRYNIFQNYDSWWSMEPPNIQQLKSLPSYQQVIEQIRAIYTTIEKDLQASNIFTTQILDLTYEDLCGNPTETIELVQNFITKNGVSVSKTHDLPESFTVRSETRIDKNLYEKMVSYASEL